MNSFGRIFRVSIFGESHGNGIGVVVDGTPPGLVLERTDFDSDLIRRKSGCAGTTARVETDEVEILSGVYKDRTTGSPITLIFNNRNTRSSDYSLFEDIPRPGHADFTAGIKYYGYNDPRGGGHFSGRLTLGLVAAGVIAKKILHNVKFEAKLLSVGGNTDIGNSVAKVLEQDDSIGGLIECRVRGLELGLGEPFFDPVESQISHLIFTIPGIRGVEFGSGFNSINQKGSEHNDPFISSSGKTLSNNSGGINGGITNGNELIFRVAVKPTSSISKEQNTYNFKTNRIEKLSVPGRHDACFALRVPPVVESAAAIVLSDFNLIKKSYSQ